jgi:hypothetical protein
LNVPVIPAGGASSVSATPPAKFVRATAIVVVPVVPAAIVIAAGVADKA